MSGPLSFSVLIPSGSRSSGGVLRCRYDSRSSLLRSPTVPWNAGSRCRAVGGDGARDRPGALALVSMRTEFGIDAKHASSLLGPDFFIVGAPKCGTTAMAAYLGQHPEIGMCPRKESHVFATDLAERMSMRRKDAPMSKERFLELLSDLQEERVRGEASVWHLYSTAAPAEIMALKPGGPDYRDAPQPGRDAAIVTFPVRLCGYRARGRIRRGARSRRGAGAVGYPPGPSSPLARTAPRSATPSRCDATSMSSGASVCM